MVRRFYLAVARPTMRFVPINTDAPESKNLRLQNDASSETILQREE
jgi:hypothetical protein